MSLLVFLYITIQAASSEGYVIISIERCPCTAVYRRGVWRMKGANGSKGGEEEEIHIHKQELVASMASKPEAKESNTHIGHVMSLLVLYIVNFVV